MKNQFVQLSKGGVKAYFAALKQERREAAMFYEQHPEFTMGQVADKFSISPLTMKKALGENGIEVDKDRQYRSQRGKRLVCPECRRVVSHSCGQKERVQELRATPEQAKRKEYIDPRRISPITGRVMDRTPDYIAYMESLPPRRTEAEEVTDADLSLLTPEQREIAELGFDGLLRRGRQELGIK